jgi:hypothetical protein
MKNQFVILDDKEGQYKWVLEFCDGGVCQDCFDRRDKTEPILIMKKD